MTTAILSLENLTIGYDNKTVLKDVSFSITDGELVGIIGPNGAGKSTLLKTIRGLLPKLKGEVLINQVNIEKIEEREFAQTVAYLQQHVDLSFGYKGKDLVMAGRYPYLQWWESESAKDEEIVKLCMEYTGVSEFMDTPVAEVSGGQRQRILLAKVLAQKTPMLFLDEPTTGLDIVYQEDIFRFSHNLCKAGKTILMVVHELNLAAKYCSRLILLGSGTIIADGSPDEVLTEENLSKAYNVPVQVVKNPLTNGVEISTKNIRDSREELLIQEICK